MLIKDLPTCDIGIGVSKCFSGLSEITVQYRCLSVKGELRPRKLIENQLFNINPSVAITVLYFVCIVISCFEFIHCKDNKRGGNPPVLFSMIF